MRRRLVHGSTFSGIGASEVAAEMLGWENVFHCEINPFGRKVLDYYFPKSKSYEDITNTDFSEWRGKIDVLTGGFPCQPFSYAGKRRGSEDDRYLWPFMLRCIEQVRPRWFVGENVAGITTMEFPSSPIAVGEEADLFGDNKTIYELRQRLVLSEIIESLVGVGYSVQPFVIPACSVNAPHRRDRVFIVAHRDATDTEDVRCNGGIVGNGANDKPRISEPRNDNRTKAQKWLTPNAPSRRRRKRPKQVQSELADGAEPFGNGRERTSADTIPQDTLHIGQLHGCDEEQGSERNIGNIGTRGSERLCSGTQRLADAEGLLPGNRWRTFPSVSPVYRGNDGLPFPVDNLTIPFSKYRRESLKAYGNAIVPQVMYEIFRIIDLIENNEVHTT